MRLDDSVPDFLVHVASHQYGPRLLHVERAGRVFDRGLDELLELFIAQGGLVGELVDGSSVLNESVGFPSIYSSSWGPSRRYRT